MKLKKNKNKNKGKVHPSPLSSNSNDTVSTLNKLLPTAILTLISILSVEEQEVLAYMITHSLSSSSPFFTTSSCKKKNNKKVGPSFDCGCFECYTTYWFRWDSSTNRELIHQAIEAFEEHLAASDQLLTNTKLNKYDASCSLFTPQLACPTNIHQLDKDSPPEIPFTQNGESSSVKEAAVADDVETESGVHHQQQQQQQHKGLARKVLPDVIGLFNSRLWNLWGPNI